MIIDSHVHTHYSHGDCEIYKVASEAIERKMDGVGFSEHFHYDFFSDLGLPTVAGNKVEGTSFDNFKRYYNAAKKAKDDFGDKIKVGVGVEVDFLGSKVAQIKEALGTRPFLHDYKEKNPERKFEFDFIMGAVHFIGQPLKYFSDYKDKGDDWMIDEYFKSIESCIKSGIFDIVAHPEIIKYFVAKDFKYYGSRVETIVKLLSQYNVAVDVNTDYMKNPVTNEIEIGRINPGPEMLQLCNARGIPLVIGSDAHSSNKLANNFDQALDALKGIGIKKLHYFENRNCIEYKI